MDGANSTGPSAAAINGAQTAPAAVSTADDSASAMSDVVPSIASFTLKRHTTPTTALTVRANHKRLSEFDSDDETAANTSNKRLRTRANDHAHSTASASSPPVSSSTVTARDGLRVPSTPMRTPSPMPPRRGVTPSPSPPPPAQTPPLQTQPTTLSAPSATSASMASAPQRDPAAVIAEMDSRANAIWSSSNAVLLPTFALQQWSLNKERREIHVRHAPAAVRRLKEKEFIAREKDRIDAASKSAVTGAPQPQMQVYPLPFALRLHDTELVLHMPATHSYRSGSALDQPNLAHFKAAMTLHVFQHGIQIGEALSATPSTASSSVGVGVGVGIGIGAGGWIGWSREHEEWLRQLDDGELPAFFMQTAITIAQSQPTTLVFYEGALIVEIRDYRSISTVVKEPTVRRMLLRPTSESIVSDIDALCAHHKLTQPKAPFLLESKLLRFIRPNVCFNPSVRVSQVLNMCHYNRRLHNTKVLSRERAQQRIDELAMLMGETLIGTDDDVEASAAAKVETSTSANLIKRFPHLSPRIINALSKRVAEERRLAANTYKDVMDELRQPTFEDAAADDTTMNSQEPGSAALVQYPDHETLNGESPSRFSNSILGLSTYVYATRDWRWHSLLTSYLTDSNFRKTLLSGPAGQLAWYQTLLAKAQASSTAKPNPPLMITSNLRLTDPQYRADKAVDNMKRSSPKQGEWLTWSLAQPVPPNAQPGRRMVTEVTIGALKYPAGSFECRMRTSRVGVGEPRGECISVFIANESVKDTFIESVIRCAVRDERKEIHGPVSTQEAPFNVTSRDYHDVIQKYAETVKAQQEEAKVKEQQTQAQSSSSPSQAHPLPASGAAPNAHPHQYPPSSRVPAGSLAPAAARRDESGSSAMQNGGRYPPNYYPQTTRTLPGQQHPSASAMSLPSSSRTPMPSHLVPVSTQSPSNSAAYAAAQQRYPSQPPQPQYMRQTPSQPPTQQRDNYPQQSLPLPLSQQQNLSPRPSYTASQLPRTHSPQPPAQNFNQQNVHTTSYPHAQQQTAPPPPQSRNSSQSSQPPQISAPPPHFYSNNGSGSTSMSYPQNTAPTSAQYPSLKLPPNMTQEQYLAIRQQRQQQQTTQQQQPQNAPPQPPPNRGVNNTNYGKR